MHPSTEYHSTFWTLLVCCLSLFRASSASITRENVTYVPWSNGAGEITGDFGACMDGGLVDITRFDVAYYHDNYTVSFHLAGQTALVNETVTSQYCTIPGPTTRQY